MKTLKCADLGNAGCNAVFKAESADDVVKQAAEHAKAAHNVAVTPEIIEKMKGLVKDEPAPAAPAAQPAPGTPPAQQPPASQPPKA